MFLGFRLSSYVLSWYCVLVVSVASVSSLRCYVCGGHSGTPCRGGLGAEQGPAGDTEAATSEAGARVQDPVQECTDLINNRGCVKQFVNGVVLLRGCWLDGTNKCLKNGAAEVCTCSSDLCNGGRASVVPSLALSLLSLAISLLHCLYTRHAAAL